jgi:CBS domain-containing protein
MNAGDRPVSDVMQREVATLEESERLDLADDIMRLGRVRHMPVVDGKRVKGIVSQRDLFAASLSKTIDFEPTERRAFLHSIDVSEVMSQEVVSVSPETTLREAARRMLRHGIGCLPVVEGDALVGLVTERRGGARRGGHRKGGRDGGSGQTDRRGGRRPPKAA